MKYIGKKDIYIYVYIFIYIYHDRKRSRVTFSEFFMSRDSAREGYKQFPRANTGRDTSEQSAKVSRSSSHSRESSSRSIYDGGEKTRYRSEAPYFSTRFPIDGDDETGDHSH